MQPYYSEAGIEIYHGDCREVLPSLPAVDLVLTDPPYGIDLDYAGCNTRNKERGIHGDSCPFDPSPLLCYPRVILWGANNYADKLPHGGWIAWDKRIRNDKSDLANQCDGELAWTNITKRILFYRHLWVGAFRASENGEATLHPTQKPRALMAWAISKFSTEGDIVLDPYMGSGTTLRAAKDLGRQAIGIEIEERYCEIAANRLRQEVLSFEVA